MRGADPEIVAWVSSQIVPFEAELRQKLVHICKRTEDIDDLVQDIYYRLLKLTSVEHIHEPRAYLFQIARHIVIDQVRRDQVVRIEAVQNLDDLGVFDTGPSPERITLARAELKWVLGVIANLPDRCKAVFRLRKIYGLSQAETAANLGVSENIVEKETMRGMRVISDMVARVGVSGYDVGRKGKLGVKIVQAQTAGHVKNR
jgi:RNA polymerase sigma factor (sigma-70 family)